MYDSKAWYASKTVWGGIIAVLAAIASAFGYAISPELQGELAEQIVAGAGLIGGLMAIYGRIKADKAIK